MLWLSAFCLFFFFPKTDFKFFKISGDKVITNETLQFSNLSGLKIILRTCFKCTVPGLKYTGFFCLFVFCTFTKLYNHHHYLIPGHFYHPRKKPVLISSHWHTIFLFSQWLSSLPLEHKLLKSRHFDLVTGLCSTLKKGYMVSCWPKSSFGFFYDILWENPNELLGQPNMCQ